MADQGTDEHGKKEGMATKPACPMVVAAKAAEQDEGRDKGRRRFLHVLLGGGVFASLVSFVYPVLRYVLPPPSADLGTDSVLAATVAELKSNSARIFRFGSRPGLLIRTASGEYRAMSATCTHLSCTVQYRNDVQQVWCACHNGMYDLNGRNISGPPPRPLEAYEVHVKGNEIYVSRKQGA
jgi:cytochrome b6-f complex iron-sulfur subunit